MVLDIVIAILLFVAGALLYTFGILRVLLILFCGVPLTRKLKGLYNGKVASGAIYLKFAYTAALCLSLPRPRRLSSYPGAGITACSDISAAYS